MISLLPTVHYGEATTRQELNPLHTHLAAMNVTTLALPPAFGYVLIVLFASVFV